MILHKATVSLCICISIMLLVGGVVAQDIVISKGISLSNTPENKTPVLKEVVENLGDAPSVLTTIAPTKGEIILVDEGKIYAIAPVTHAIAGKSDADREAYKAEYASKYAKVVGHNKVTIDDKVVLLDILDMAYLKDAGVVQLNLSATVDGKEKRIRNPVKIRSPPVMVYSTADNAVEDPTSAMLESLAYIVQGFEDGEPTFSDGDPVLVVYSAPGSSVLRSSTTWSNIITGVGTAISTNATDTHYVRVYNTTGDWHNSRTLVPFNTSGILLPSTIIENASVNVYGSSKGDSFSITPALGFTRYGGVADFLGAPTATDYNKNMTGSTRYGTDIPYASFSTAGYNTMYFNNIGIYQINRTGITPLMGRIDNDIDSVSVTRGTSTATSNVDFYNANYTGTTRDPYLSITYGEYNEADDDYTVALLHFNGINDGTGNFTDQYSNRTWTRTSPLVTATNASKFGPTGAYFGNNGQLATAYSQDFDFGTGDWTVDAWTSLDATTSISRPFYAGTYPAATLIQMTTSGIYLYSNTTGAWALDASVGTTSTPGVKYHIAVVRNGTAIRFFKNGVLLESDTIPAAYQYNSYLNQTYLNGYNCTMDEVRITKGLARWNTHFTPPFDPYELIEDPGFTMTPDTAGSPPQTIQFTDDTPSSDWTVNTFNWSFGDGNLSTDQNPSHTYLSEGSYTVNLTVTNNNMSAVKTAPLIIGLKPDFTASPLTGSAAMLVTFTNATENTTPISSYSLDFGDGETTTDPPDADGKWYHVYSVSGVFSPNLTVTSSLGTVSEYKRDYIVVSTEQNEPTTYYTPKEVTFTVKNWMGISVSGASVSAIVTNSSFSDAVYYLMNAYGYNEDLARDMLSNNTTMSGITGADGSIVFTMHPSLQYNLTATGEGSSVSSLVYPSDPAYTIWLPKGEAGNIYGELNATLTFTEPNSSYFTLGMWYLDEGAITSSCMFYVNASNGTPIYQASVVPGSSNVSLNTTLQNIRGESYYWGLRGTRTGGNISLDRGVTSKGPNGVLVDLGIPTTPVNYYPWIGLFLIFLVGSLASKVNIRFLAILVALFAALLQWFGWMSGAYLAAVIPFCGVLAFLYYMKGSLRENYGIGGPGSLLMNIIVFLMVFQMSVGFITSLGVFQQNVVLPDDNFSNVGLTEIQENVGTFAGINDPLQASAEAVALGWTVLKTLLTMIAAALMIAPFLAEMFPYVPVGVWALLQGGIYLLYLLWILKMLGRGGAETDL